MHINSFELIFPVYFDIVERMNDFSRRVHICLLAYIKTYRIFTPLTNTGEYLLSTKLKKLIMLIWDYKLIFTCFYIISEVIYTIYIYFRPKQASFRAPSTKKHENGRKTCLYKSNTLMQIFRSCVYLKCLMGVAVEFTVNSYGY